MGRLFCITLLLYATPAAYAQWTGKAGINFIPAVASSAEVTTEFGNRWYALTADAGYTFNTGYTGIRHLSVLHGLCATCRDILHWK